MNVGSVFSGVGLLDLGLSLAGHDIVWHCESDPWRRDILAKRWPGAPCYEDIRDVGRDCLPVDLLAGGPPCQPVSLAGKGLGDDDERWLWPEFFRALGELRPRYALMENPSALLARDGGRLFGDVLGGLAEVGYDAEWSSFPAAAIGAPHRRDRTFIVAYPRSEVRGFDGSGSAADSREGRLRDTDEPRRGSAPQLGVDVTKRATPDASEGRLGRSGTRSKQQGRDQAGQLDSCGPGSTPDAHQERRQGRAQRGATGFGADAGRSGEAGPAAGTRLDWSLGDDAHRLGMDYWWSRRPPEPCLRGLDDGRPRMVGRSHMLGALGDGVVVAVGQFIGERLMEADR